jgi:16S rRNA (uracil1498-N3)-methyltransferase
MSRRRFYVTPEQINESNVTLSAEESHHLARVLRLRTNDEAFVFDGQGHEYRCRVGVVEKSGTQLEIIDELKDQVESPLRLTLAQALAKGEKFDFIVQKATELGVSSIAPIITDHTDIKLSDDSSARRLDRWQRISLESLKQSGRRRLVSVLTPVNVKEFIESLAASNIVLVMSERGGLSIIEALKDSESDSDIVVIIGPEGGWSDGEYDLFQNHRCKLVTLGPRILRTETAAIAAVTLVQHALGDISK